MLPIYISFAETFMYSTYTPHTTYHIGGIETNVSKTIHMDVKIWSEISRIADKDFDGDVNDAVEHVCRNGLDVLRDKK